MIKRSEPTEEEHSIIPSLEFPCLGHCTEPSAET